MNLLMPELITSFCGQNFFYTNSFEPNLTSRLIVDSANKLDLEGKAILDLGCGCGALGLSLIKLKPKSIDLLDFSQGALQDCKTNINNLNLNLFKTDLNVIQGDCFTGLDENKQYDLIINDVSGISETIAKLSPWFTNAPCNSGVDGISLFKRIILQAKYFLRPGGILLSPLLSLSNITQARLFLDELFLEYQVTNKHNWFLPDEMALKFKEEIEGQIKSGNIALDYKFGKFIAWTEVLSFKKEDYR